MQHGHADMPNLAGFMDYSGFREYRWGTPKSKKQPIRDCAIYSETTLKGRHAAQLADLDMLPPN